MHENNPRVSLKAAAEVLGVNRTTLCTWTDTYGTERPRLPRFDVLIVPSS